MIKRFLRMMATLVVLTQAARSQESLIPFAPPWNDGDAGPTDLRPLLNQGPHDIAPVRVRNGRLFAGDRRLRLFGVNVTAGACFPERATAEATAARLAKFGVNGVRFHFLDATWGEPALIDFRSGDWNTWNADALARFDYYLAQLKQHGIFWNINLLVGRAFSHADGVAPAIRQLDWKAAHAVGFFHEPHLKTQKAFARRLLTRVNPHTGIELARDPALAMVEINNENGLIHTWFSGAFDNLPEPFAGDLQRQWNAWLLKRYATTAALAAAWGARHEPPGDEMLRNHDFSRNLEAWNIEQHHGARVTASVDRNELSVRVDQYGTAGWSAQVNQSEIRLRKGGIYTVRFRIAADSPRQIYANVMQTHDPWQTLGWQARIQAGPEWTTHAFTFVATEDNDRARLGFTDLSQAQATFRFADLSLKPGGRIGLDTDETLETGSIRWPRVGGPRPLTAPARHDWVRFLWETEQRHWEAMHRYIVKDLGVEAPVVGTIVATSTPNLMAAFPLTDTHAYWQHPHFPGRQWDMTNWIVEPLSMVDHPAGATLSRLAWQRVVGKPHMVSEYNHPAPNPHAGEGPMMLAALAGLQDWDALFYYTWAHDETGYKAGRITGFFDIAQHPAIMANLPAAALLFRRGDVSPARTLVTLPLPPEREIDLIARQGRSWSVLDLDRLGLDLDLAYLHRVALDPNAAADAALPAPPPATARREWPSDTGEILWRLPEPNRGLFLVRTPRTKAVIGRMDGQQVDLGDGISLTVRQTRLNWCAISLSLLEGESFGQSPRRALLTATATAENTGMRWTDDTRRSVGQNWGQAPSLAESVPLALRFPPQARATRIHPLNDRGQRAGAPVAADADGAFNLGPQHRTLWYEVEFAAP